MLDSVRNNLLSGWSLVIIISICALPFVFLGTGSLGTVFGSNFGSVNGEKIEEIDIQIAQSRVTQNYREIFGDDFDFSVLSEEQLTEEINNEIIRQKVILAEVRSLGLLNKEEIRNSKKEILKNQDFYIDGQFDEGRFEAFVNANGFTKDDFIEMLTRMESSNRYLQTITSNFVTNHEIKSFIELIEKTVDIDFIKISFDEILNTVFSSLEEQAEYYQNNSDSFLSEEKRGLQYFKLDAADFIKNITIPENYFEEAYLEYSQEVNNSSQKRISHIMIDKSNYNNDDDALQAMLEVQQKIISGDDFAEIAQNFSEDLLTKDSGGDLDYFSADLFPTEFETEVNNLSLNEVSNLINLETTIHIIKVTEVFQEELLSFEDKKAALEAELMEAEGLALLNEEYFEILDLIDAGNSFTKIHDSYNAEIKTISPTSYANFTDEVLIDYKDDIFSMNSSINIISNNDELIIYTLDSIEEPRVLSFEEVQESINEILVNQKAILVREEILQKLDSISSDEFLDFASQYPYLTVENFINVKSNASILPRDVINQLFEKELGTISLIPASNDYYLVSLYGINKPSSEVVNSLIDDYKLLSSDQVNSKLFGIINNELYTNIRSDIRIGVN
jgi:peptidyl-prolyl cis-trans isomerase D